MTIREVVISDFASWRVAARALLSAGIPPHHVLWCEPGQGGLFAQGLPLASSENAFNVSKEFVALAEIVSCYRGMEKWALLYRVLWRILHEERHLLRISIDDDIHILRRMEKEIRRDCHKMKAFVRFRQIDDAYVAWHEPSHLIVHRTAPFFARRFSAMQWTILTPDASACWDGEALRFGPGVPRSDAPSGDAMEELWKTFYRNIFNPARIKVKMMKSEMPVKYWHTMPETALIPRMLEEADARVKKMLEQGNG